MKTIERCTICGDPTGKAGPSEDSLFLADDTGPVCEECFYDPEQSIDDKVKP